MLIFLREEVRPRGFIRDFSAHHDETGVCGTSLRVTVSISSLRFSIAVGWLWAKKGGR